MYISKVKLHNFMGFKGDHEFSFNEGVNFLVGNNNCGKTTVFKAINAITSKTDKDHMITKGAGDYVSIEVELRGADLQYLQDSSKSHAAKYARAVLSDNNNDDDDDGELCLRILRSSHDGYDYSKVYAYTGDKFENVAGVDKTIGELFDAQIVWADMDSSDIADFGKTKVCGRLINLVTSDISAEPVWSDFMKAYKAAFEGESSIATKLQPVEQQLKAIIQEQYGEADVKFNFQIPNIDSFLKSGDIQLSENGVETASIDKGNGMQRALAMALIQVYADKLRANNLPDSGFAKSTFFMIDEPETFLHPQAQDKLLDSLEAISKRSQIFIATTHHIC